MRVAKKEKGRQVRFEGKGKWGMLEERGTHYPKICPATLNWHLAYHGLCSISA